MKHSFYRPALVIVLVAGLLAACSSKKENTDTAAPNTAAVTSDPNIATLLNRFDTLDFDFYSHQRWDSFAISHDPNIKVYYPDGTVTTGLYPQHIDMLTPMFAFAPDTKITNHPIKFGSGKYTAVIGEMEGTFSKPMPIGNGKFIQPTGKKFKLSMATIGVWKDGKMTEEHLFWDNQAFMKQIGLAQ